MTVNAVTECSSPRSMFYDAARTPSRAVDVNARFHTRVITLVYVIKGQSDMVILFDPVTTDSIIIM